MSISKQFGKPLNQNLSGISVLLQNGVPFVVSASDLDPGSKGQGHFTIDETYGGGPFHIVMKQNGKTILDKSNSPGGNVGAYTIGEKIGANPNLTDGDVEVTITGAKHAPKITSTFDAAK